jgi:hypothetical protein
MKNQWQETEPDILLCSFSCHRDGHPAFYKSDKKKMNRKENGERIVRRAKNGIILLQLTEH